MLPSLGCFSSLECPFYNGGSGQCSRPYCHYRHVKRDPNAPPEQAEDILGLVPSIEPKIEDDTKAGPSTESSHKSRASIYKAIVDAAPAYNPTPIAQLKSSHIPIPYTPTNPTRSSVVKKSKSSSEYVPHYVGTHRPSYPPYCPSSISSLNSQVQSPSLDDPLKNPLYEIYGPEGAQYSPNDVDPIGTGYSYAPPKSAAYAPYSPEYVSSGTTYNPQCSPRDSQPSDDDDNVDLAAETAAQTNGDPYESASLIDLDLSELDNLEIEFESDDDNKEVDSKIEDASKCENRKEKESVVESKSHKEGTPCANRSSPHKGKKRRSSSTNSTTVSKKHKSSHDSHDKNGIKEKKTSSSSSSLPKQKSSSSSSSHNLDKKSSSHSSSKSKSSSSSSSKSSKSSKSSSSSEVKKSHSSDSKSKSSSSSSSSSSKHKDRHQDKEKPKMKLKNGDREKEKEKEKHQSKEKNHSMSKHSKKHSGSSNKEKQEIQQYKLEEEIRKLEAELDASLEDEDTIEQQCYEMFSEYSETMLNQPVLGKTEDQRVTVSEEPVSSAPSKKRIAHQASHSSLQPKSQPAATLAKKCTPYQVMKDRWEMLKKQKKEALDARVSLEVAPPSVPRAPVPTPYSSTNAPSATLPSSATGKKKIAGVANVAMLLKPPTSSNTSSRSSLKSGTPPNRFYNKESQRIDEFGRLVKVRVAHIPNMDTPIMRKPVVNPSDCRKFKVATRQANVNKLYQAYLDAGFGDASHDMALESEKSSTQGTESLGVYSHRIIQIMKDLRTCAETSQNGPKMDGMSGIPNRVVSHSAMLAGKLGARVSWSIQSAKKETESKAHLSLYEQLQSYILTKEQLAENGFPMQGSEKGVASIKPSSYRMIQQPSDPLQRVCIRCLRPYSINKRGEQVKEEECFYHWGRKLTMRQYRQAETRYTCCDGTGTGCTVGPCHVFEQNWEKNSGYMSTLSKPWMESDPGVYALDCEMCYTTAGLELTRVTVIREDLSVAYETLVKPAHKILDYNTRYSGITEEDLKDVSTSILQVQATLLGMFCDKTILIGHSLESDMKALKLIHPTVIDTSVVFPHKMGPPQKRALRNLAADYLKKIIQNDVGGHDSKEDAVAALELMLWKLKEDEKTR